MSLCDWSQQLTWKWGEKQKKKKVKEGGMKWCYGRFTLWMRQNLLEEGMTSKHTAPSGTVMLTRACTLPPGCIPRRLPTPDLRTAGRARELSHNWGQLQMKERSFRQLVVSIWHLVTNQPALWPVILTACTSCCPCLVVIVMQSMAFQHPEYCCCSQFLCHISNTAFLV